MTTQDEKTVAARKSRRGFLRAGAAAAVAGGALAMPNISRAQTVALKIQGSWGAKDVFNEMAQDYIDRANAMGGGRLKLDYLIGGAVVHPFSVQDATHKGVIDGAHTVPVYWYGKHKAASLFGSGPVFGANANQQMGWFHNGGGKALFKELVQDILKLNIVSFFAMPITATLPRSPKRSSAFIAAPSCPLPPSITINWGRASPSVSKRAYRRSTASSMLAKSSGPSTVRMLKCR